MIDLRKKLIITFTSIALLAIINVGVSVWDVVHWHHNSIQLSEHYKINLLIKNIQTCVFQAYETTLSALAIADENAERDFDTLLTPVPDYFTEWKALSKTDEEKKHVVEAKKAYEKILKDGKQIFALINKGHFRKAYDLENKLKTGSMNTFTNIINDIISSDRSHWLIVSGRMENSEKKANWILLINICGTLLLVALKVIYLSSDIFSPLRKIKESMDEVSNGNLNVRLSEARGDELGGINASFNNMVHSLKARLNLGNKPILSARNEKSSAPTSFKARIALHTMLYRLQSNVKQLGNHFTQPDSTIDTKAQRGLITQIDQLLLHITHITEIGSPLKLNLAETDIRLMIHQLIVRFQQELITRKVNFKINVSPEIDTVVIDMLKIRESLVKIIQYTIDSIPQGNRRIEIGVKILKAKKELLIYITNNGTEGNHEESIEQDQKQPRKKAPLMLIKSIAKQHGGQLVISDNLAKGCLTYLYLPHRSLSYRRAS